MIVAHLVSYLPRLMTQGPGDIIVTGTPPGVGAGRAPPRFLRAGDTLRLGIADDAGAASAALPRRKSG